MLGLAAKEFGSLAFLQVDRVLVMSYVPTYFADYRGGWAPWPGFGSDIVS